MLTGAKLSVDPANIFTGSAQMNLCSLDTMNIILSRSSESCALLGGANHSEDLYSQDPPNIFTGSPEYRSILMDPAK